MKSNVASTTCEIRRRHFVHCQCHAHIGQPQCRTWSPMHRTKNNRDNVTDQLTVSSALHHGNTMTTKYCTMETISYKFRNAIEMAGRSSWFLAQKHFRPILYCVIRKYRYLSTSGTFSKLWTQKISSQHVDRQNVQSSQLVSSRKVDAQRMINWTVIGQLG